jgi:hypothetical protein
MVSLKWLFLTAAATVSVLAQDPPTGDAAEAAAYWEQAESAQLTGGDSPEKRDVVNVKAPRNDPVVLKDPYKGSYCWAPYTAPPCATTCNRNNCYRGFLNARDGSSGKVNTISIYHPRCFRKTDLDFNSTAPRRPLASAVPGISAATLRSTGTLPPEASTTLLRTPPAARTTGTAPGTLSRRSTMSAAAP